MTSPLRAMLSGTGRALPERVVTNDDLSQTLDTSDEWIRSRTGIRERRIAAPDETSVSLGLEASRRALAASGLPAADLDLIVCATLTPDHLVPTAACQIQAGLGCRTIPAFDLNAACSGFIYALATAAQFIQTGTARHALVVGAETLSRAVDFTDRNTCVLFGDGAGAAVLSAAPAGSDRGLRWYRLGADGTRGDLIKLNGFRTRPPAGSPGMPAPPDEFDYLRMNGREVFRFAVLRICSLVNEALAENDLTLDDLALIVPHQVNQRILTAAVENLKFPPERVMVNLDKYGNTSAASVPMVLDEAIRDGRAKPGDTVLCVAFGGGLTWSSALLKL
jgi:3-oxoacyl-[acyl-carrier-protein] synthase-3